VALDEPDALISAGWHACAACGLLINQLFSRGNHVPQIELLAPARDMETGVAAIDCGADAVYIGAPRFGAREAAGNSLSDIGKLVEYAHRYWARVYVTLNTLLHDDEVAEAVRLAHQMHEAGADALIIQDVGLLECDLPPIPLFASTQMHNNSPEKVSFLEQVGIQRVILARELSLQEIRSIRAGSSVELEAFIHGALCVCHSGQCYLSYAFGGRSGNRGECAQPCRKSYSLLDEKGNRVVSDRYLLSIRDLNLTGQLRELLDAGVTSFKIEGRLKDKAYVMNVVGHYRREIDAALRAPGERKSSSGTVELDFAPDPDRTFNRGYTSWYLSGIRTKMGATDSPKMVGEPVGEVVSCSRESFVLRGGVQLHNGDGIAFYGDDDELVGTLVNRAAGDVIYPAKMDGIRPGRAIFRNRDHAFLMKLEKSRARRRIGLRMCFSETPSGYRLTAIDEDGVTASKDLDCEKVAARKPEAAIDVVARQIQKLGDTQFACTKFDVQAQPAPFLSVSVLNDLRRGAIEMLTEARRASRPAMFRRPVTSDVHYPKAELSYLENVLNRKAESFYRRHGVTAIEPAAESGLDLRGRKVMTTTFCIKYELDACPRLRGARSMPEPLYLLDEDGKRLRLEFDCASCLMEVICE
jgi:23S rRNA 5-hydroxycytidine C2501 synthase